MLSRRLLGLRHVLRAWPRANIMMNVVAMAKESVEEYELEFPVFENPVSIEAVPRIWMNNPAKRLSSCSGQYPELEENVGRLYPSYGPSSVVRSPSCVRLGSGLLATAHHAVPEVIRLENIAQEAHTRIPYQFANNAMVAKAPLLHLPVSVRLPAALTERPPDKCPLSNVSWETTAHEASAGADVCFLREDHPLSQWGIELSREPLQVGEEVVLCAYIRPFLSWEEGWHWLQRTPNEELAKLDPELLELKDRGLFYDSRQLQVDVVTKVCKPFARAMHQHCLRLAEDGNSYITKIISHGKVLATNDGLVAVDNASTTYASGGGYVRLTDPTKLVLIHLGSPKHADPKYGNYNLGLRVDHPSFVELYNQYFNK